MSREDDLFIKLIRKNINDFLANAAKKFDKPGKLLDIAPDEHEGAKAYFSKVTIQTLNIDPDSGADYIADLCIDNSPIIPSDHFDYVVCTEVLEHTLDPFGAVRELARITKPGGFIFVSTPFNFRIHGPAPDNWRFTENGLRTLFSAWNIQSIVPLPVPESDRDLMPLHYTLIAQKKE